MQLFTKIEKQLNLSINKTLSSCYRTEHGIAGVPVIRNSKLWLKPNSPRR